MSSPPNIGKWGPVRVGSTPLFSKWPDITPVEAPAKCALGLEELNKWVNNEITYTHDIPKDFWQSPQQTLETGTGDCEDLAILKYQLLQQMGIPCWVVVAKDLMRYNAPNNQHAFVVTPEVALDITINSPVPLEKLVDYRPIAALSEKETWLYGD